MAYYCYMGVKYGVCSHRPIWKSLLVSIPIINLLYTKKIRVSLTSRNKRKEPVTGVFGDFRIFRWQKTVKYRFMVPNTYTYVYVRVMSPRESKIYATDELQGTYFIDSQYYQKVDLHKKKKEAT